MTPAKIDKEKVKELRAKGMKYKDIAKKVGCCTQYVYTILREKPKKVKEEKLKSLVSVSANFDELKAEIVIVEKQIEDVQDRLRMIRLAL